MDNQRVQRSAAVDGVHEVPKYINSVIVRKLRPKVTCIQDLCVCVCEGGGGGGRGGWEDRGGGDGGDEGVSIYGREL